MIAYYQITFVLSVIFLIMFLHRWNKNMQLSYAAMVFLVTISNMGALLRSSAKTLEAAVMGNTVSYLGGCFLQVTITFCILALCRIRLPKWIQTLMILPGVAMYAVILTDPWTHIFYKTVTLSSWRGVTIISKDYALMHTMFYVLVIAYFLVDVSILAYGALKKKDASVWNIFLLFAVEFISILVYFIQKMLPDALQLTAVSYVIAEMMIVLIIDRIYFYDVDNTVMAALRKNREMGCFSFSLSGKYLGCNTVAQGWMPELAKLHVDRPLPSNHEDELFHRISHWMEEIKESGENREFYYHSGDRIYKVVGGYFTHKRKIKGYQFSVRDNTREQQYIDLLNRYNTELAEEVEEKTKGIREMHQRFVLGMADMVESRDPSTGGHIKRTSRVVRILVEEMQKDESLQLDKKFCKAVIKAAPMHDLGKIAVDDAILRKPGKFTPEEFAVMKSHAENGAGIVRKLLTDTEDDYFAQIAENVAHYHHERVDGTGYPCGLKGGEIPFEARIMAIADVYDALVSTRCYKKSMSFEEAFSIIEQGMGTQFDASLDKYFVAVRPKLEEFYREEFAASA